MRPLFIVLLTCLIAFACNERPQVIENSQGNTVHFPEVSAPIQLVDNGKEHL